MEKKCFVALLMVVVMMCACWTGAVAEDVERETFTFGDHEYALLDDGTVEINRVQWKSRKAHHSQYAQWKKGYFH